MLPNSHQVVRTTMYGSQKADWLLKKKIFKSVPFNLGSNWCQNRLPRQEEWLLSHTCTSLLTY